MVSYRIPTATETSHRDFEASFMDANEFFLEPDFRFEPYPGPLANMMQSPMIGSQPSEASEIRRRTRIRASRACIPCRSRHMKCDAIEPRCTRCQLDEKTCIYAKSRRGGSNKIDVLQKTHERPSLAYGRSNLGSEFPPSPPERPSGSTSNFGYSDIEDFSNNDLPETRKLICEYYEFFHYAHPFILPKRQLCERLQHNPDSIQHLFPVLEYIGSMYMPDVSTGPFRQRAQHLLDNPSLPLNGFSVQALLLFAIGLHCSDEYERGDHYLDKAIDIALSINMHHRGFAAAFGENDASTEESWRRTWWFMYFVDVAFAGIGHAPSHRLQGLGENVSLPCEEWQYERGIIPPSQTIQDYDNREFSDEQVVFSSFTYLIDVGRIMSGALSILQASAENSSALAATDAKSVNWILYLPKSKQNDELVKDNHRADEVMFLAHVFLIVMKLLIHRPHSSLPYSPVETLSKCTPPTCTSNSSTTSPRVSNSISLHTSKSISALASCISIFSLPSPYLQHSPLTTCSLSLAIMAQVSACNHVLSPGSQAYQDGRERIRLGLGVLRKNIPCWAMARRSVREVCGVARELLRIDSTSSSPPDEGNGIKTFSGVDFGQRNPACAMKNTGSFGEAEQQLSYFDTPPSLGYVDIGGGSGSLSVTESLHGSDGNGVGFRGGDFCNLSEMSAQAF